MLHVQASSMPHNQPSSILDMSTLAERLVEARTEAGISQAELGRACGVTRSSVWQWENGYTSDMKMEHIFKAADRLGVRDRWLALGQGPKKETGLPQEAVEIAGAIERLRPSQRQAYRAILDPAAEYDTNDPTENSS